MGNNVDSAVANPVSIDMGGTYSNSPGLHPKLMMYKAGSYELGFGFSGGQFEYIAHGPGKHVFFSGAVRGAEILSAGGGVRLPSTGVFGLSASTADAAADSGLSRGGANKLYVGNGTSGNSSGTIVAGAVGIGSTTPALASLVIGNAIGNYSIDAGTYRIGNVGTPVSATDAVTKSYLDSAVSTAQSAFWNLSGSNLFASSTSWNVGIGTTNPGAKLEIESASDIDLLLDRTGWVGGETSSLKFRHGSSENYVAQIQSWVEGGASSVAMRFYTSTGGAKYERMVIRGSGNVGIGTTNPVDKLDVSGNVRMGAVNGSNNGIYAYNTTPTLLYSLTRQDTIVAAGDLAIGAYRGIGFKAGIAAVPSAYDMYIAGGNVGIATTTPTSAKLVIGAATNNYTIDAGAYRIGNVGTPVSDSDAVTKSYLDSAVSTAQSAFWNLSGSNLFASSTSWNVGIGTNTPVNKLDVYNAGTTNIKLTAAGAGAATFIIDGNADSALSFHRALTGERWKIYRPSATDDLRFYNTTATAGDRVTFQAGGNVGIGTTNPLANLEILATSSARINIKGFDSGKNAGIYFGTASREWKLEQLAYNTYGNNLYDAEIKYVGTTLGGNLLLNPAVNVGIATTTPTSAKLVIGDATNNYTIDAGTYRIGNVGTPVSDSDAVTKSYLDSAVSAAQSAFWNLSGSNLFASSTSWNVGIGTTTPQGQFQVLGVAYTDSIPAMTANNAPSPLVASASTNGGSSYLPWYAFNKNNTQINGQLGWITQSGALTGWLMLDLGAAGAKIITAYSITAPGSSSYNNAAPKTWTLQGSNNNVDWTTLDTQTNVSAWQVGETRQYVINNQISYRYYKLDVTLNSGNASYLMVGQLRLLETSNNVSKFLVTDNFVTVNSPGGLNVQAGSGGSVWERLQSWKNNAGLEVGSISKAGVFSALSVTTGPLIATSITNSAGQLASIPTLFVPSTGLALNAGAGTTGLTAALIPIQYSPALRYLAYGWDTAQKYQIFRNWVEPYAGASVNGRLKWENSFNSVLERDYFELMSLSNNGELNVLGQSFGSECLSNPNLTDGTSWTATGGVSLVSNAATYSHNAAQGSLTQSAANLSVPLKPNRWYRFTYTTSASVITVRAYIDETITSAERIYLPGVTPAAGIGNQQITFKTNSNPSDFKISFTSAVGAITLDNLSLKEIQSGNIVANGQLTGGGASGIKINELGNVGIATTTPTSAQLVIGGASNNYTIDAGNYRVGNVGTPVSDYDAVNKSYLDSAVTTSQSAYWLLNGGDLYASSTISKVGIGTSSPMANFHVVGNAIISNGLTMGGDINMGDQNITNLNKLTVNTIDPLYRIKGTNYSTFASAIVGGVKEEYVGRIKIGKKVYQMGNNNQDGKEVEYEAVVDFNNLSEGSDLWVWRQVVDYSSENIQVLITPFKNFASVYYNIENNKLVFRSDRPAEISYRLIGKRLDWRQWPTKAKDQKEKAGFIID